MLQKISNTLNYILHHPLAGKHKIKTLQRFFKWQLSQLLNPKLIEYPFIGNSKFWVKKGLAAATANVYTGLHEFNEMGFLLHFLRKKDVFADIGANIGTYTILASSVIGAKTIAVEPIFETYQYLLKNIQLNKIELNVNVLNIGISSKPGELYFTTDSDSMNHVVSHLKAQEHKNVLKIQVDTLDNIVSKYGCPILIKIDVEGFEQQVLNGGSMTLKNEILKAVIIELNGSGIKFGYEDAKIHQQLIENNFIPFDYNPFVRSLKKSKGHAGNNIIFLRDLDFVESRIMSSQPVKALSEIF